MSFLHKINNGSVLTNSDIEWVDIENDNKIREDYL